MAAGDGGNGGGAGGGAGGAGAGGNGGQGAGADGGAAAGAGATDDDDDPLAGLSDKELAALGDPGKRALERLRDTVRTTKEQLAAASAKAQKYDELEEANKSELEKLQGREKDAADRAANAELQLLKLSVALEAGLPHTMAPRLQGATKAELAKDAETLAADLKVTPRRTTNANAGDGGGSGGGGGGAGSGDSMDDWIRGRAGRAT